MVSLRCRSRPSNSNRGVLAETSPTCENENRRRMGDAALRADGREAFSLGQMAIERCAPRGRRASGGVAPRSSFSPVAM